MSAPPRKRSMFALMLVVLVGMTGFGIFFPVFPFLAKHVGATPTETTLAMGCYSFGQLVAAPFWGRISDRFGRKPVLTLGLLGAAVSYIMLSYADTVLQMGGARLFGGLMAGNLGAAFAAAADLADDKTRARNMGLLGAAVGFGFIAGPAFGGIFVGAEPDAASFDRVCYAASICAMIAVLCAMFLFKETHPESARHDRNPAHHRVRILFEQPNLGRLVLVMFLMIGAQALMESIFALWALHVLDWGPRHVGYTLAGVGLGAALLQGGGAGALARHLGERTTMLIGLGVFAISYFLLAQATDVTFAIIALAVMVVGGGLATPALQSLIASEALPTQRGAVIGFSQSAAAFGRVLGPASAGAIFDQWGQGAPFMIGGVVLALALAVGWGAPKRQPALVS